MARAEVETAASGHSPLLQEAAVASLDDFPHSREGFREYLTAIPFAQRNRESLMFIRDMQLAGEELADYAWWQSLELAKAWLGGNNSRKEEGAMTLGLTGFHSHESSFWPLRNYLRSEGHTMKIFHPEAHLNLKPLDDLEGPLMKQLEEMRLRAGDNRELVVIGHSRGAILNMITAARHPNFYRDLKM